MTSDEIGIALMSGHFSPVVDEVNWFRITHELEDYRLYVGRLPDVYLEKKVPTECFEYERNTWMLYFAMDMVNEQMSPVKVFMGRDDDNVTFRMTITPGFSEELLEDLPLCMGRIEQTVSELGHACTVVVRENGEREAHELMEALSDPSPENPWIQGKTTS